MKSEMNERESMFRFAGIQLKGGADKADNISRAVAEVRRAATEHRAQVVALPEMFACPYSTATFEQYAEPADGAVCAALSQVSRECGCFVVGGSFPERGADGRLYNTCPVFSPSGTNVAMHRKVHLFKIDAGDVRFDESEVLGAGDCATCFDTPWCTVGVGICFDVRFPEYAHTLAVRRGCKLIVYPGAFNPVTGPAHWDLLLRARAVDCQAFVAGVAPARDEKSAYASWGHSRLIGPWGDAVAAIKDDKPGMFVADVDLGTVETTRRKLPALACRRTDLYEVAWKGTHC